MTLTCTAGIDLSGKNNLVIINQQMKRSALALEAQRPAPLTAVSGLRWDFDRENALHYCFGTSYTLGGVIIFDELV